MSEPTAPTFHIGDKVLLKSGSPDLEVIGISRNGKVWCDWKDDEGVVRESSFHPFTLVASDDSGDATLARHYWQENLRLANADAA